ncbi:20415_t:CDS:2, partial [Gigaspora rosea]
PKEEQRTTPMKSANFKLEMQLLIIVKNVETERRLNANGMVRQKNGSNLPTYRPCRRAKRLERAKYFEFQF